MADDHGAVAAAGWFDDPAGSDQLRWWNGSAWTEHLMTPPPAAPAGAATVGEPVAVTPVEPAPVTRTPTVGIADRPAVFSPYPTREDAQTATPTRWNTAAVWGVVLTPLVGIFALFGAIVLLGESIVSQGGALPTVFAVGAVVLPTLWCLVFALRDRRRLLAYGHTRPASVAWILLGPLGYLIARTVRVRAESGRGWAPLWSFVGSIAASVLVAAVAVAVAIPIVVGVRARAESQLVTQQITTALRERDPSSVVSCPTSMPIVVGRIYVCDVRNATVIGAELYVTITSASGQYTVTRNPGTNG